MKTIILSTLLGLVTAAATMPATAQTIPQGNTVEVPGHALRIDLPAQPRYMMHEEFRQFAGAYDLSNGDTLQLRRAGTIMYARIGNQDEHRIVATGRNSFVALDRQLKVRIDHHDDGSVGGEVVMVVPARQLADGSTQGEHVAVLGSPSR
ncbi:MULTISPECIES: hypothetical protein [unclassified Janthinobacterium]|uniref:hypothetical protein n=1 Tax=unclassified Janthinobacterium TaxID=2610881 RepID=UPI0018CA8FB1|nr:hypothetical protein [Janthinobacterium sp. CG_23.4]MDH6157959.1 hypothetical protein [Janthinobacterium sp. CG_23.4]